MQNPQGRNGNFFRKVSLFKKTIAAQIEKIHKNTIGITAPNHSPTHEINPSPTDLISSEMREVRDWRNTDPHSPIESTVSGKIWSEIPGGHKWLDYFNIYDSEFSRFRNKKPRILEIGVYKGASLKLWKRFFGEGAMIVGVDIDPSCFAYNAPDDGVFVEIGSQADQSFLREISLKYGPFDLIIDDGSHVASHQIASFNALFDAGLKDGGSYFVEDLECMYWGHTNDYRDQPYTSIDFFKMLADLQNSAFRHYQYNDFALHVDSVRDSFHASELEQHIASVKFYRGVVVVDKRKQMPPRVLHI